MFRLLLLLLCWGHWPLVAQELPPVTRFAPDQYRAGNQNWMLSQDEQRYIYAANNDGLMEFNGEEWRLYPVPNESIVRSVLAQGERIYTGSYMDFGVWTRTVTGQLTYRSLTQKVSDQIIEDEQFWNIIAHQDLLVFQSLEQFFFFDPTTEEISILKPAGGVFKVFRVANELYFTNKAGGLYTLKGSQIIALIPPGELNSPVVHLWASATGLLLQTAQTGVFELTPTGLKAVDRHPFLKEKRIYSAAELPQGGHVFGTISNGLFVTNAAGKLEYQIDQVKGLTNNTVLSVFVDAQQNTWAGTDNGISCINASTPLRKFTDRTGQIGTVHASARYEGKLYLGSNQGLFVESSADGGGFVPVKGTRGQVWSLYIHQGELFCGHDDGTYLINGEHATLISSLPGTWTFCPIPGREELLLQGYYEGLSVLEKTAVGWKLRNQVAGFDYSARFVALRPGPEVYVSHEYRGTYGLKLDDNFERVIELKEYDQPPKGKNGGLALFMDTIYHYSQSGLFALTNFSDGFHRSTELDEQVKKREYISGNLSVTDDRMWFFTSKSINCFELSGFENRLKRRTIRINNELINAKSGYENIALIGKDTLLIGTSDGYLMLTQIELPVHQHEVLLSEVKCSFLQDSTALLPVKGPVSVVYQGNNLTFSLTVADFDQFFHPNYQFRLLGWNEQWSEWSENNSINFPRLGYGEYVFEARSLLGKEPGENTIRYAFTVLRPWYASYVALGLYVLGGGLLIFMLNQTYSTYYRRKEKKWQEAAKQAEAARLRETELELTRVQNNFLQKNIENKNRETAIATMNLVKQNELLQTIKQQLLGKNPAEKNIQAVVKTIDQNLDTAENWNLFKEAFENADRDFFKKIKALHPDLTPNDLKVCAYLRLNLTTKEIASMLNISSRSVEVKRYRLRKKIGLDRDKSLVEHIISI